MSRFQDDLQQLCARNRKILDDIREEREREEAVPLLHRLIASYPGTIGKRVALMRGAAMAMQGRTEAGGALVELAGPEFIRALVEAGASPPVLRNAIETALLEWYRELPGYIAANGGRAAFADWCRQARFTEVMPADLPETVDIYRGTMGCSPAAAAKGLHWSLSFDDASRYACRFADEHLTGVIVLHARVPREGIACYVTGTGHSELVPAEVPIAYKVVTDHKRIDEAAVRCIERMRALLATPGWTEIEGSRGIGRQVAMATRARMAAAGIPPGTAIVA